MKKRKKKKILDMPILWELVKLFDYKTFTAGINLKLVLLSYQMFGIFLFFFV